LQIRGNKHEAGLDRFVNVTRPSEVIHDQRPRLLEHERAGGSVKGSDTGMITDGSKASVSDDAIPPRVWW
jgi:hypothetical protein